ncbi:MAG: hypothetical protein IJ471_06265 [Eubacterium sp.]|nr:hypothetical protein [Eubacterium sp.]
MAHFPKLTNEDFKTYPKTEWKEEWKGSPWEEIFNRPLADVSQEQLDALNNGPCNPQLAMPIENRSDLFLPGEQSVEIGYCAMPDGTGFVANRTFFPNATPEMLDWWMNFHPLSGERLAAWLPNAHLDCYVREPYLHCDESGFSLATRNWGKEHMASEGLTSLEESGLCRLKFYSPQDVGLDMIKIALSPVKAHAFLSVVFFGDGLVMFGEEQAKEILAKDPNAQIPFNCLLHTFRPVPGGCELRSRFWIGKGIKNGVPYTTLPKGMDAEAISWVMLRHTIQEMSNLASFLPEMYNKYEGKILLKDIVAPQPENAI